jgi:hypothetical protein
MTNNYQAKLRRLEQEINTEAFEAFYHIGQKLLEIKRERLYEHETDAKTNKPFKSWGAYCASGRLDYKLAQADNLIRASELRPKLPETPSALGEWSVEAVKALCKCETDNDAKRVAKKSIAEAKKRGERVTARLIGEIRDGDGETGATTKKHKEKLQKASLAEQLNDLSDILVNWRTSLEALDSLYWESVDKVTMTRVIAESNALTKFLRS